jgi:ubiquitin carboxyl-terminal hydrolase 22/27/51
MCFYVKRHLDYKPYVTPSYIEAARKKRWRERKRKRKRLLRG